jgi:hypothetical protein
LDVYKNYMPAYVKYVIRVAQIEYLGGAMRKETKMEEIVIETNVDPEIILGKVQRQMDNLVIANQQALTSNNFENEELV